MILPLVVMRRLDQVLEPTRDIVIAKAAELAAAGVENPELALQRTAREQFFNRHLFGSLYDTYVDTLGETAPDA